ncbi:chemotaxis protein CheW [Aurantiacibacter sediminis]|uniref:CheW domain-containing protein n=1 Tax=Aurantiacibacter sediminis TaxID=2793064 RepID=A0ABS0N5U3_9SPHN|nr:chemotaxis protein CheW [Aurantiacibacter sediminis]MBH5323178.1 CheW domain-containing protein [Aurantiacibacter sediminis]
MSEPIFVAHLADRRIAFAARRLESIVEISKIMPVPRSPDHIEGLTTLRSQTLTVINCRRVLGVEDAEVSGDEPRQAAVVKHGMHQYALLLDDVEDVVEWDGEIKDILGGVGDAWERMANGVVETEGGPALLLNVEPFIEVDLQPVQ